MLKTASAAARGTFRKIRAESDVANNYISFIHRNFPREEKNQYLIADWTNVAEAFGLDTRGLSRDAIIALVRQQSDYMARLRELK